MPIFRTVGQGSPCLPSLCWLQPSPHGKLPTPEAEVFPETVPVRAQPLHCAKEYVMPSPASRRDFLRRSATTLGAAAAASVLPGSISRALAVDAAVRTGTIKDVEHVVILMQENRGFDHYFGTMRGVRGFGDRFPIPLESGKPVWYQSDGAREIPPYHLDPERSSALLIPSHAALLRRRAGRVEPGQARLLAEVQDRVLDGLLPARRHPLPVRARRGLHHLRRLPLLDHHRHRPQPHHVLVGFQLQPRTRPPGHQLPAPTSPSPTTSGAGSPASGYRTRGRRPTSTRATRSPGTPSRMYWSAPASAGTSTRT